MKEAYEDLVGEPMVGQKPSKKLAKKLKAAKKAAAAGGGGAQPAKKAAPKKAAVKASALWHIADLMPRYITLCGSCWTRILTRVTPPPQHAT